MINIFLVKFLHRLAIELDAAAKIISRDCFKKAFPLAEVSSSKILKSKSGIFLRKFEIQTVNIPGMISQNEAISLFHLSVLADNRGDIVEIGSWLGKSTVYLAKGCQITGNGVVHAIDIFKGNPGKESLYERPLRKDETIFERFKKNIASAGVEKYIKIYQMTSKQARKKINCPIRILFIDGNHTYDFVKEDILLWKNLLVRGGYLVLDDFDIRFPGSVKAIYEQVINSKDFTCLFENDHLLIAKKV